MKPIFMKNKTTKLTKERTKKTIQNHFSFEYISIGSMVSTPTAYEEWFHGDVVDLNTFRLHFARQSQLTECAFKVIFENIAQLDNAI